MGEKFLLTDLRGLLPDFNCREIDWLLICELGLHSITPIFQVKWMYVTLFKRLN